MSERDYTVSANPSEAEQAEANRQYDEVVAKYMGSPLWMKAPLDFTLGYGPREEKALSADQNRLDKRLSEWFELSIYPIRRGWTGYYRVHQADA